MLLLGWWQLLLVGGLHRWRVVSSFCSLWLLLLLLLLLLCYVLRRVAINSGINSWIVRRLLRLLRPSLSVRRVKFNMRLHSGTIAGRPSRGGDIGRIVGGRPLIRSGTLL